MRQLISLPALATLLFVSACKKDSTSTNKDAQPNQLRSVLSFSKFSFKKTGSGNYEYGCLFRPKVSGKVTALSCLMPDIGTYTVRLWDTTGRVVLATASITQNDTLDGAVFPITPISVKPEKVYLVSIKSSTRWYELRPLGSGLIGYPLSSNYVDFIGYQWTSNSTSNPVFPKNSDNTYIAGIADFTFQPD